MMREAYSGAGCVTEEALRNEGAAPWLIVRWSEAEAAADPRAMRYAT